MAAYRALYPEISVQLGFPQPNKSQEVSTEIDNQSNNQSCLLRRGDFHRAPGLGDIACFGR